MSRGTSEMEIIGRIRSRPNFIGKLLMISAIAAAVLASCGKKEQMISGKPASHWLAQLEDSNPDYVSTALEKLEFSDEGTSKKLRKFLTENRTRNALFAIKLYYMDKVIHPECGTAYLEELAYIIDDSNKDTIHTTAYGRYFNLMEEKGHRTKTITEFDTFIANQRPDYRRGFRGVANALGIPWKHGD